MSSNRSESLSLLGTVLVIGLSVFVIHRFILPLAWAAIVAIATYPIYLSWLSVCRGMKTLAALSLTILIAVIIALPLSWLLSLLIRETHTFIQYLLLVNKYGQPTPQWLVDLPWLGSHIQTYWQANLAHPGNLNSLLASLHLSLSPASQMVKQVGITVMHHGIVLFFTILCLFFMYRDGVGVTEQIHQIGRHNLGARWRRFAHHLPAAMRATVNGTIFVGFGVGVMMGVSYSLAGIYAPVLLGFLTAILAMIPFGGPLVFILVALVLIAKGSLLSGILIVIWGVVVMFVADHVVKPMLIGTATRLPFLAVLFGILGGVETMGLIGLFLGPIVMVLFITLWQEQYTLTRKKFQPASGE